jgi:DNA-binding transcriptional regulator YdaS (Cro superfamily)
MQVTTPVVAVGLEALKKAIDLAGGQAGLAKRLDEIGQRQPRPLRCKPQNVWAWLNRDFRVPGEWARHVSEAVEFRVLPAEVRPDIYPNTTDGLPPDVASARSFEQLLEDMSEILRADERAALAAAFERGPQYAIQEIESLEVAVDVRARLLAAAQAREERAA